MRRLIAFALVGACAADPAPKVEPRARAGRRSDVDAPRAVRAAAAIPPDSTQLVVATVEDWETCPPSWPASSARPAGRGRRSARAGRRSSARRIGLGSRAARRGAPAGRDGPIKREGDGKSPAGAFALGASYGYATRAPRARVSYTALDDSWQCVDDPRSSRYNRVLDAAGVTADWSSAETMRRADALYRWVVDVAHNPEAAPGAGSCIFLHVWSGPEGSTAGCTAMDRPVMERLLAWLDPAARPVFVLLPAAERAALRDAWALP